MVVKETEDNADIDAPEKYIYGSIGQHEVDILHGISQRIGSLFLHIAKQYFKANNNNVYRGADQYQPGLPQSCSHNCSICRMPGLNRQKYYTTAKWLAKLRLFHF